MIDESMNRKLAGDIGQRIINMFELKLGTNRLTSDKIMTLRGMKHPVSVGYLVKEIVDEEIKWAKERL
jgi:hypothetical protein